MKSEKKQGAAAVFRVRELLIRLRTQTINALRVRTRQRVRRSSDEDPSRVARSIATNR